MSKHNNFMQSFFTSLADVIEVDRADADRRSQRNYSTVTAFTAREYDRELEAQLVMEYNAGLMMGVKL